MATVQFGYSRDADTAKIDELYKSAKKTIGLGTDAILGANPEASTAKIRSYGDQVADIADRLPGYAEKVRGYGDEVAGNSRPLVDTGADLLGIGGDILNMNRNSSSPLVQEILRLYGAYGPEKQVSFAAQDMANAYDRGYNTQKREMSRQGINPSSGRSSWLDQQYQIAKNSAIAAAMTRRRGQALGEQASAFQSLVQGAGQSMLNQGKDFTAQGNAGLVNAAGLEAQAAGLDSNAASLFGSAASLEANAANLDLGYAGQLAGQYDKSAAIDTTTASYYANLQRAIMSAETAAFANQDNTRVYEDMDGNRTFVYKGNVSVVNKSGWQSRKDGTISDYFVKG